MASGLLNKAVLLVTLGAWAVFLYQLGHLCHGAARPTDLRTVIRKGPLKSDTLPVTIMVCASPGYNQTRLQHFGYSDAIKYVTGRNTLIPNTLGWEGHMENGTTIGPENLLKESLLVTSLSDLVTAINHKYNVDSQVAGMKFKTDGTVCFILENISVDKDNRIDIWFKAKKDINFVEVVLVDSNQFTQRTINIHKLNILGDIVRANMKEKDHQIYNIELTQEVFMENDPNQNCTNYPTEKYPSYAACDEAFIESILGAGVVPPWNSDNMQNISARLPPLDPATAAEYAAEYDALRSGMRTPPCHAPCKTTKAITQLASSSKNQTIATVTLSFKEQMAVTVTDFTPFSLSIFLSNVGGSLGLWLGLGLLQLGELAIKTLGSLCNPTSLN